MIIEQVVRSARQQKTLERTLRGLQKMKKHAYHPLITALHKKHAVSKKTLFYVKEYAGDRGIVTILKESFVVLLFASAISALGGASIEGVKTTFISVIPLLILLPTLNDMIGDYGTIISSKFSALLHENKINTHWTHDREVKKLTSQLLLVALISSICATVLAFIASTCYGYSFDMSTFIKILCVVILDVLLITFIMIILAVKAGIYLYKKKEDPNNFLIPITTSIGDFLNAIILALLVIIIL